MGNCCSDRTGLLSIGIISPLQLTECPRTMGRNSQATISVTACGKLFCGLPFGPVLHEKPLTKRIKMRFKGKMAVVTGAGAGLGKAVARGLVREGAGAVFLLDMNEAALATTQAEIG